MNIVDILLLILIAAIVILALRSIRRAGKNGKGCLCGGGSSAACSGNCSGCSAACSSAARTTRPKEPGSSRPKEKV